MLSAMRLLYLSLLSLLLPVFLLGFFLRGPAYRARFGERLGSVAEGPVEVWVHAVSVGETMAAAPLIRSLIERHGERRVWVTSTTPTGAVCVRDLFGDRVLSSYAPYDLPWIVSRFLRRVQPRRAVIMETELWPSLFRALRQRGIPLMIANARLSPRSFHGYQRVAAFARQVLGDVSLIAAQSATDAERFRQLGARRVQVSGNIKFDLSIPADQRAQGLRWRESWGAAPVWAAVSTHEGEEAIALEVHRRVLREFPQARVLLVPRHPQRFDAVERLIRQQGWPHLRRSQLPADADFRVLLGDSMGEMFAYLAAADVAFVGGSLVPVGGHNLLEPAAIAKPVLHGPHMHNFLQARALLNECGAAREVAQPEQLAASLLKLLRDDEARAAMGRAGEAAVSANRGAVQKLLALMQTLESGAQ